MSDLESLIKKYCTEEDPSVFDDLPEDHKQAIIDTSFKFLFQKAGNSLQRTRRIFEGILEHFGEIKIVDRQSENYFTIYTGQSPKSVDYVFDSPLQCLERSGVVTIPVIPEEEIEDYRRGFLDALRSFPEYKRHPSNPDLDPEGNLLVYVYPGFAALGNPASFHNPFVRQLRQRAHDAVASLMMHELIEDRIDDQQREEMKLEVLFDRMMYRIQGQKATSESWHRDVMPGDMIDREDEVFGGWVNLDPTDQYFSCIPGSHLGIVQKDIEEGFATVPKSKIDLLRSGKHKFRVPPGHCVLFPQYILHEVVATAAKKQEGTDSLGREYSGFGMMRAFMGWRLTMSTRSLRNLDLLEDQYPIPLPGGMHPPMFDKNHSRYFIWSTDKNGNTKGKRLIPGYDEDIPGSNEVVGLIDWSERSFKEQCLVDKHSASRNMDYRIVHRYMGSLKEYDLPLYEPYTDEEKSLYAPHRV